MAQIIKRPFKSFNGTDWDKHYFETSADQVIQDATHRFVSDAEKANWNTGSVTKIDEFHYKILFPNGLKAYYAVIDISTNNSLTVTYPSGLFTQFALPIICTMIPNNEYANYEQYSDPKVQLYSTSGVQIGNYADKLTRVLVLSIGK